MLLFDWSILVYLREKTDKMSVVVMGLLGSGVKVLLTGAPIQVEAGGRGSDVMHLPLESGHFQVGQIT